MTQCTTCDKDLDKHPLCSFCEFVGLPVKQEPWLTRQLRLATEATDKWPEWKRLEAGLTGELRAERDDYDWY